MSDRYPPPSFLRLAASCARRVVNEPAAHEDASRLHALADDLATGRVMLLPTDPAPESITVGGVVYRREREAADQRFIDAASKAPPILCSRCGWFYEHAPGCPNTSGPGARHD